MKKPNNVYYATLSVVIVDTKKEDNFKFETEYNCLFFSKELDTPKNIAIELIEKFESLNPIFSQSCTTINITSIEECTDLSNKSLDLLKMNVRPTSAPVVKVNNKDFYIL